MRNCTRFALAALMVLCSTSVGHSIPQLINYQGVLTDGGGTPITVATTVEFRIWDMDVGGTELWMESQSVTPDSEGRFSVLLGSVTPIPDSALGAAAAYLGLAISPDAEMSPRSQMVSVGYAYRPGTVDGATGGEISSDLVVAGNFQVRWTPSAAKAASAPGDNNTEFGVNNDLTAAENSVVVGEGNTLQGINQFVVGSNNTAGTVAFQSIVFGSDNFVDGQDNLTVGDQNQNHQGNNSSITGGLFNTIDTSINAVISGGESNLIRQGSWGMISGGRNNSIDPSQNTDVPPLTDLTHYGTIGGGFGNVVSGSYAAVGGGLGNIVFHDPVTQGRVCLTLHPGGIDGDTSGVDPLKLRAAGGLYLTKTSEAIPVPNGHLINTLSGAHLTDGGDWVNASDRNKKENFEAVDRTEILEKIAALDISEWNYKSESDDVRHIGPTAQDFYALFGVGTDDRSISTIDPAGIALAAIQELHKTNQELRGQIGELQKLMETLMAERQN